MQRILEVSDKPPLPIKEILVARKKKSTLSGAKLLKQKGGRFNANDPWIAAAHYAKKHNVTGVGPMVYECYRKGRVFDFCDIKIDDLPISDPPDAHPYGQEEWALKSGNLILIVIPKKDNTTNWPICEVRDFEFVNGRWLQSQIPQTKARGMVYRALSAIADARTEQPHAFIATSGTCVSYPSERKTDYYTIIRPYQAPKPTPCGGTHASPVGHDRRGHWRIRNGVKIWIRSTKVNGGPEEGRKRIAYKLDEPSALC